MGVPYTLRIPAMPEDANPLIADSGQDNCFEISAPQRGTIRTIVMSQESGALAGATFELFTRQMACASSESSGVPVFDDKIYSVFGEKSIAGSAKVHASYGTTFPYVCEGGPTVPDKKLYLRITPGGSGEKEFVFRLDIEIPDF